ncbi:MAG: nitroreductase [Acidobacteria bacterium]|nr:nitroreductase [Acidobacteriota bacterium]
MMLSTPVESVKNAKTRPGAGPALHSVIEAARRRYSCRLYNPQPMSAQQRAELEAHLCAVLMGPLGTPLRFRLIAATVDDPEALRGLGTYGFIKGAQAFIVGAMPPGEKNLEDYGYEMERAILHAATLGLGTCWLGGSFTKSRFARAIATDAHEKVPAVASVGLAAEGAEHGRLRTRMRGHSRLPWAQLFFRGSFGQPLSPEEAGQHATALEALRLAPSASNKQPWRVVQRGKDWHFFLQRTPGYGQGTLTFMLLRLADLQRVDMGIAMCHFELARQEAGGRGRWVIASSEMAVPDKRCEYAITWTEE